MRSLPFALLLAPVLASGCAPTVTAAPIPVERLADELADLTCARLFGCCSEAELAAFASVFADQSACHRAFVDSLGATQRAAVLGRRTYDAQLAGTCYSYVRSLTCSEYAFGGSYRTAPAGCDRLLVGLSELGAACEESADCIPTAYCGVETPRSCRVRVALGEDCTLAVDGCAPGTRCVAGRCANPLEVGAACTESDACLTRSCSAGRCVLPEPVCDGA